MKCQLYFKFFPLGELRRMCPSQRIMEGMEYRMQFRPAHIQRRFAKYKAAVEKAWEQYPFFKETWVVLLLLIVTSCAPAKYIVPNDTITATNHYHGSYERDSIYLHDSIYVREYIVGDTIYRDKIVEHYQDRWLSRTDTILNNDTTTVYTPVEVVKEVRVVPAFYKWCAGILIVVVIGIIARIVLRYLP